MANYLTYGAHLRQAAEFLLVPLPGDEPNVTISDAFKVAIQRLQSKLDDYALVGPSITGFAGPNIRGLSQGGASAQQPCPGTQQ